MTKKISVFLILFFLVKSIFAQPPGKEKNPDWPCIQVYIELLSWGSIWTGPVLDENSSKWINDEKLSSLAEKIMKRNAKENEGIKELKKYIKKNNSPEQLTKLFHALFDTTNIIWKKRNEKLTGTRQKKLGKYYSAMSLDDKHLTEDIFNDYKLYDNE